MNAVRLRNLLLICIVLAIGAIGTIIYFASEYLQSSATTTTHARIDAELSAKDVDQLKNLEKILEANTSSIQKVAQIVSESKQYEYQDQIVKDINTYATKTGVNVVGYDFGSTTTTTVPSATSTSKPIVNGIKTQNVTLTLGSPMPFDNYLMFLKAIEQNLTKMQVSGINITPDDKIIDSVSNPSVVLIVYVR